MFGRYWTAGTRKLRQGGPDHDHNSSLVNGHYCFFGGVGVSFWLIKLKCDGTSLLCIFYGTGTTELVFYGVDKAAKILISPTNPLQVFLGRGVFQQVYFVEKSKNTMGCHYLR